jgi:hypothetical protein
VGDFTFNVDFEKNPLEAAQLRLREDRHKLLARDGRSLEQKSVVHFQLRHLLDPLQKNTSAEYAQRK